MDKAPCGCPMLDWSPAVSLSGDLYCEACGKSLIQRCVYHRVPSVTDDPTGPTHCAHCGEPLGNDPRAELAHPNPDPNKPQQQLHYVVHAESCAQELMREGWDIA